MPQPLLNGASEYFDESPVEGNSSERIEELEERIGTLEASIPQVKRDAVVMVLNLLGESLRHIASGKMDITEVASPANLQPNAKWDAVKQRLAPRLREAVDIFLVRGSMNNSQLAAALHLGRSNCSNNVIGALKRQGLLVKSGNDYSLKQL